MPTVRALLDWGRARGLLVVHTREGHRPTWATVRPPSAPRHRRPCASATPGPMGRILVAGEPGNDIVPELAPRPASW